jgi:peptidoglycan/xylan/chitin deacetylase (PgdA/CDA1 family)
MRSMKFVSLCYHYIRDVSSAARFPRILGNSEAEFRAHLDMLTSTYHPLSLEDLRDFYYRGSDVETQGRIGVFVTFDDGLSDHYLAAKILNEYGIKGIFFIPTCALRDGEPANPLIIHYVLAHAGISKLLQGFHRALQLRGMNLEKYGIPNRKGDPYGVISEIKKRFKYSLPPAVGREILLDLHRELLLKDYPNAVGEIHLTAPQVREMLDMGHSIGVHSHTHLSVGASALNAEGLEREVVMPQSYLAETFGVTVDALSYPFGDTRDCLGAEELVRAADAFRFAFTVEPVINTRQTNPFEIGRYMPHSKDDVLRLGKVLAAMNA